MKKKKTRRSEAEFPALDPKLNLKTRYEILDYDYLDKLSQEEKQWLNNFSAEYVNADFKTNKKRIHRKRKAEHPKNKYLKKLQIDLIENLKLFVKLLNESQITSKSKSKLKKTVNKFKKQLKKQILEEFKYIKDFYKKDSEDMNNARNACILTKAKARGMAKSLDLLPETYLDKTNIEDQIIAKIDGEEND